MKKCKDGPIISLIHIRVFHNCHHNQINGNLLKWAILYIIVKVHNDRNSTYEIFCQSSCTRSRHYKLWTLT